MCLKMSRGSISWEPVTGLIADGHPFEDDLELRPELLPARGSPETETGQFTPSSLCCVWRLAILLQPMC